MRAVIITEFGPPDVLKVEERPKPEYGDNEILIQVKASGVNRPDVIQRQGKYPAPPGAPADIQGLEVAGVIEAVGKNVTAWEQGDHVCALVAGGGYSEYVKVLGTHCLPIPAAFSFTEAAGLPETFLTVWHNVFQRGKLAAGETLLIHGGSSGIGITAIQLAKIRGSRVVVTVGSEEKGQYCLVLGADSYINYKTQDFGDLLKDPGIDVVLDMVGGDYFSKNINILKPDGRLVYINAMKDPVVSLNILQMMRKRLTITGSTLRNREASFKSGLIQDLRQEVWPLLNKESFEPVVYATFSLEEAAMAHQLMESSRHIGKIILVP
ncbi:MAG: NAD(P)H-quinone oxidoreductase [Saprospiraceae bacterium]|nr:NAD(P)H-quinone oxidoreductase [Saprospiraceae bacterium]